MAEAPAFTRVVAEQGQHLAEVTVFLDIGGESRLRGPPRKARQEALKDCLELRKVAAKNTQDPAQFALRRRIKELKAITWTVKDLGGRQLDGAEGPPPGCKMPAVVSVAPATSQTTRQPSGQAGRPDGGSKFRGVVRGKGATLDGVVEVADVTEALGIVGDGHAKAEVALRKAFARFGPVIEVRMQETAEDLDVEASVRFASVKGADAVIAKAKHGFLPLLDGRSVRVRQPAAAEAVLRKFAPRRRVAPELDSAPSKKKLRPNERFASKLPTMEEQDESERFWEAQHDQRGKPAEPPPVAPPAPEPPPAPAPEPPAPTPPGGDASEEDRAVYDAELQVSADMRAVLEKPFSQQRKAVKAIRVRWHPDKNPDRQAVATRVFQFVQAHEQWLAHHELG